jgi:ribose 1,5-bisphosphokinase PhnN
VSRGVLHEARKYYPHCNIIHIDVPQSIAEERVKSRGRDKNKALSDRLSRMKKTKIDMPQPDKTIHNDDNLEKAVSEFTSYLEDTYYNFHEEYRIGEKHVKD